MKSFPIRNSRLVASISLLSAVVAISLGAPPLQSFGGDPQLPANDHTRWFDTNIGATVRTGNRVKEFVDAYSYFDAVVQAIRSTTGAGHFVYIAGWWMTDSFNIVPPYATRLITELTNASARGVEIRALLWDQQGTQNTDEVARINALANGAAILDNRTLNIGSHHQKIICVNGSNGFFAFCGGIDLNPDRIYATGAGPNAAGDTAGAPLNDVQCRVDGGGAFDILQVFRERWMDHPSRSDLPAAKRNLISDTSVPNAPGPIAGEVNRVQIGRTYGNGNRHRGIDNTGFPRFAPKGYSFAPNGAQQCAQMILKGISGARKFIYIEDQYFVDTVPSFAGNDVRAALITALTHIEKLIVLIPESSITPLKTPLSDSQTAYRRSLLINALRAAGGAKVQVFHLAPPGAYKTYVHSKTWIFDDEYAIIGSANCNRRSWTHDSEIAAGIWDQGVADKSRLRIPHQLRMLLWSKYLNITDMTKLRDGLASAAIWSALPPGSKVQEYDYTLAPGAPFNANYLWDTFIDPDGS